MQLEKTWTNIVEETYRGPEYPLVVKAPYKPAPHPGDTFKAFEIAYVDGIARAQCIHGWVSLLHEVVMEMGTTEWTSDPEVVKMLKSLQCIKVNFKFFSNPADSFHETLRALTNVINPYVCGEMFPHRCM